MGFTNDYFESSGSQPGVRESLWVLFMYPNGYFRNLKSYARFKFYGGARAQKGWEPMAYNIFRKPDNHYIGEKIILTVSKSIKYFLAKL